MMIKPLTGRGVLLWLGLFFGAVIAVNTYYITLSVETFRGEDEQKPYLQGIEYNQTLARRAEQARMGWTASVTANRLPDGHVRVAIALRDRTGVAENGARLSAELRHPMDENRDEVAALSPAGGGRYTADVGKVSAGVWDVLVTSTDDKVPFEATARLWVP